MTPPAGPGAPPPFPALTTFTSSGGSIVTDAQTPGVGQGAWVQTGDRTFSEAFVRLLFDSKGQFAGTQKVWQSIAVSEGFDAWSGPAKVEIRDPTGKLLHAGAPSVQATRMRVEAIQ